MSAVSFESMLRRLAMQGRVDLRPLRGPDISSISTQRVAGADNSPPPSAMPPADKDSFLKVYLSHIDPDSLRDDVSETPQHDLPLLLETSRKTLAAVAAVTPSEPGLLLQLRSQYARRFHPDRLPRHLYHIANSKMAEVNAHVDAAIAAHARCIKI